ncbi:inositol monophosphatase [Candidatus Woesebacteria bacterium]|nr:inositol monophosphatase [Candidatus Woesebacteria bacterium]
MIEIMKQAALAAAQIQMKYFRQSGLEISDKTSHNDLLTIADVESQRAIKEYIVRELASQKNIQESDIGFIGEEDLHSVGTHTFIIDPIDGTANYATGNEEFCTLIGYEYQGELQAGVMYFPVNDWMYQVEKGKGVTVTKRGVSQNLSLVKNDLHKSFLYTSLSYPDDIEAGLDMRIPAFQKEFRGIRLIGCAGSELGLIAEGTAGVSVLVGCSIWDLAPGKLILDELGYGMYDWSGNEVTFDLDSPKKKYPFFACHPDFKEKMVALLHETKHD